MIGVYGSLVSGKSVFLSALASLSLVLVIPVVDFCLRGLAARLAPAPAEPDARVMSPQDDGHDSFDDAQSAGESEVQESAAPAADTMPEPAPAAGATVADEAPPEPSHIEAALLTNFRLLLALALIKVVSALWGVRILDLVDAIFGEEIGGALSEIAIAVVFAIIVWQIVKAALVAHAVPEKDGFDMGGDGGAAGLSRVQTLMPLLARTVGAVLVVMVLMIALSAFGVDIGPLLAGAGVIGLAVGFGAQTLVRDIVSGVFYLVDDAFRMGEYLRIGDIRGTVEKISVRSLRLRHHRGPLHTLPYGEIHSMTNYSRDYAIMKFEVRVPFETDVEMVRKLIKQVGTELAEHEEHAEVMLEPLKSQGVNRMDDSSFVIRCKFTTIPGKQFTVRRVAFAMIQEAFAREGIKFAPKRVVVETVAPAGSKEALAAAAAAAEAQAEVPGR
jgi:small-conductance mechanosensitive channel